MERDLRREEEDICVRLLLLLLYLSFNSNIQFNKINKINDLTSEMNYMINKKKIHFWGSFSNQILCCELL